MLFRSLKPHQKYLIEADDEELTEDETDAGGILALNFKRKDKISVRIYLRKSAGPVHAE